MTVKVRKSLPLTDWPPQAKQAWESAIQSGSLLDEQGPAAHWSEKSRVTAIEAYGRWLVFIQNQHPTREDIDKLARINRETMNGFVQHLQSVVSASTVAIEVTHLYRAIQVMYPRENWRWLREWATHLENIGRKSRRVQPPPVDSQTLYRLGFNLMAAAGDNSAATKKQRFRDYRDGLVIALLAARPLRRRTLAALSVGRQVVKVGNRWHLVLAATDVKNRRPLEYPLPADLSEAMDTYLSKYWQPMRANDQVDALWLSTKTGRRLQESALYDLVKRRTKEALGVAIHLHAFRHIVATTISREDPDHVLTVAPLLGHATLDMAYRHYIVSQGREAVKEYQNLISKMRQS